MGGTADLARRESRQPPALHPHGRGQGNSMKLVSDTHTQRVKTPDGLVYVPPGKPFDVVAPGKKGAEAADAKIADGRARPAALAPAKASSQKPLTEAAGQQPASTSRRRRGGRRAKK